MAFRSSRQRKAVMLKIKTQEAIRISQTIENNLRERRILIRKVIDELKRDKRLDRSKAVAELSRVNSRLRTDAVELKRGID